MNHNRTAIRRRCWCGRPVARDVPDPIECAEHDDGPPLPRYAHWTPDSGTHELPRVLPGPYWETHTVELHLLDLRPPVPTRIDRRPWLVLVWLRLLASPAADHLRAATRSTFWPAVAGSGVLLVVVLVNVLAAGGFVTWDGFQPIPAEAGAR